MRHIRCLRIVENKCFGLSTVIRIFFLGKSPSCSDVDFCRNSEYNIFELLIEVIGRIAEITTIAKKRGGVIETKVTAQRGVSEAMRCKLSVESSLHGE